MNVFRSLARDIWNVLDVGKPPEVSARTLDAVRQKRVPAVLGLSRFRDGFDQLPQAARGTLAAERAYRPSFTAATLQRDGFEGGAARRSPVDLHGGLNVKYSSRAVSAAATPPPRAAFTASLGDLASLLHSAPAN